MKASNGRMLQDQCTAADLATESFDYFWKQAQIYLLKRKPDLVSREKEIQVAGAQT